MFHKTMTQSRLHWLLVIVAAILLVAGLVVASDQHASAQGPSFHPTFELLDENGDNVLASGNPISTMTTCGECHDTEFIERHSFHADVGLQTITTPGEAASSLPWDFSDGLFGEWNPITYRYLSAEGDEHIDLTTAGWLQVFGPRHAGGGPAVYGRDGDPLTDRDYDTPDVQSGIVNSDGELTVWDWSGSGVVEMNCLLCHMDSPDTDARRMMLEAGAFQWANTATLAGTGIVTQAGDSWQWNHDAFAEDGTLVEGQLTIRDPENENCGTCHGLVHAEAQTPLALEGCEPTQWSTITSGQIYSPQRMEDTGINLSNKANLGRSYDVHAERVLSCTDCHYALNNPIYYREDPAEQPDHLNFDPRRIDLGEYLFRPLHEFAKGSSPQGDLASEFDNTMRRCESCHNTEPGHDWLPYQDRHMQTLSCETCHVPKLYAPARQYNDWTVLRADGTPYTLCRGVEESGDTFGTSLIYGYEPVLLPQANKDGTNSLAPHNLITSWYWVYGDPARPVPYRDLQAAWLDGEAYHADIVQVFDADGDGLLDDDELLIDTDEKTALVTTRLEAQGLQNPRVMGDIRPYSVNHNVTGGEWAIKDCQVCHTYESRVNAPIVLADRIPNGIVPTFVSNDTVTFNGEIEVTDGGTLIYTPRNDKAPAELYILGHDNVTLVDLLGALVFAGVLVSVTAHSSLRYVSARRRPQPRDPALRRTYMYTIYERQWHWLQTVVIMLLLLTGLIIHKPDIFGSFSFSFVVELHNILAALLVINAGLALFYHLASGEIRQFLPEPRGFFGQAFAQALYYTRGIFRGEAHPMQKTPERKMNPLQQLTYLAILNILLPLQVITGALMWGVQTWPDVAERLGGLGFLAPLHTLVAWSFAAFIVAHVYLTTTAGSAPLDGIKSMITGWEEVEDHHSPASADEA